MIARAFRLSPLIGTFALTVAATSARADAIDGNWCFADGRHISIEGPRIVTPGGARITGHYERHGFDYVVPPREPGAGSTIKMVLLNEETVRVTVEEPQPGTEIWRRCGPPIS